MAYSKRKVARRSNKRITAVKKRGNKSYRGFKRGGDYSSSQSQNQPYVNSTNADNEPPENDEIDYEDVDENRDIPDEATDVWNDESSIDEDNSQYEEPSPEVPPIEMPAPVPVIEIPVERGWFGKMYDTVNVFKGGKTRRKNKGNKSKRRRKTRGKR